MPATVMSGTSRKRSCRRDDRRRRTAAGDNRSCAKTAQRVDAQTKTATGAVTTRMRRRRDEEARPRVVTTTRTAIKKTDGKELEKRRNKREKTRPLKGGEPPKITTAPAIQEDACRKPLGGERSQGKEMQEEETCSDAGAGVIKRGSIFDRPIVLGLARHPRWQSGTCPRWTVLMVAKAAAPHSHSLVRPIPSASLGVQKWDGHPSLITGLGCLNRA